MTTRYAMRYAIVKGANSRREVEAYLPDNYDVIAEVGFDYIIGGVDFAGWTLDGYVIPRLSSGNMGCRELVEAPF